MVLSISLDLRLNDFHEVVLFLILPYHPINIKFVTVSNFLGKNIKYLITNMLARHEIHASFFSACTY